MAHFARTVMGVVTEVIVADQEYIDALPNSQEWIQTSYNTRGGIHYKPNISPPEPSEDQSKAFRKNYASIGYIYDQNRDAFIPPQPFPSWSLNAQTCLWDPPTPYPEDGKPYYWDESTLSWKEIT
jgi:hypothetical protein